MPFYDYFCNKCSNIDELYHGMKDNPKLECSECKSSDMERMISSINVNVLCKTLNGQKVKEKLQERKDMAQDLVDNYGVHDVTPTKRNVGYDGVYKEIKKNSQHVKDTMKETVKQNEYKNQKKQKERAIEFQKIKHKRIAEVRDRQAKKAYEARSINPIKGKPKD